MTAVKRLMVSGHLKQLEVPSSTCRPVSWCSLFEKPWQDLLELVEYSQWIHYAPAVQVPSTCPTKAQTEARQKTRVRRPEPHVHDHLQLKRSISISSRVDRKF